jgi:hypothetical protein
VTAVCGTERPSPEPEATIRFAALGDSVTVGLGDRMPQGGWRGWAAILASSLAPADQVELTNLARCGALIKDVANEQLPQALALRPTFASVLVGVNDTLPGKFDPAVILSPVRAIVFIAVHQGLLGLYLGCAFAPNHKGMPVMSEQDSADFLRRQVLTSRNVTGGAVVETLLGGLNYQIEHHLFPGMPRPSLRRCRVVVRAFCAQIGVLYCEKGLVSSYSDVLRNLHAAGQ